MEKSKSFKDNKFSAAMATVTLRNQGIDAYKPQVYGEKIIIERRVDKNNTSSYKLKNEQGEVISKKRSDIQTILDQFNIQIDNPCSIMTQDVSRRFLGSTNLKDKYDFFMKATQLKKMLEDYDISKQNKDTLERVLKQKQDEFEEKITEFKKIEKNYQEMLKLESFEKEIDELTSAYAWALVKEKEANVAKFEERLAQEKEKMENYIEKNKKDRDDNEKFESDRANMESKLDQVTGELQKITEESGESTKKVSLREKEKGKAKSKVKELEIKISNEKKSIEKIKDRIKGIKDKVKIDRNAEMEKREKALANKQKELEKIKADLEEKSLKRDEIGAKFEDAKRDYQEKRATLSSSENHLSKINSELTTLKRSQHDKLGYFGEKIKKLLEEIEKNKDKFNKLPIGPIGLLLTIKDKSWGYPTELFLGGNLHSFILDSTKDSEVLKDLCKKLSMNPPSMVVSKFASKVYDIKSMDGLNPFIKNMEIEKPFLTKYVKWNYDVVYPTVMNVLIDFNNIESVVYIDTREDAKEALNSHRDLYEAWTKEGTKLLKQGGGGSISTTTNHGRGKLWLESYDDRIKKLETEGRELTRQIDSAKDELHDFNVNKNKYENELTRVNGEITKMNRYKVSVERDINEIKNDVPEEEKDDTPIINEYEEQIQEKRKMIEEYEKEIELCKKSQEDNEKEIKELQKESRKVEEKKKEIEERMEKYQRELEKLIKDQSIHSAKKSNFEKTLLKYKDSIKLLTEKRDSLKTMADEALNHAIDICPERKDTNKSSGEIAQKKEQIVAKLNHERERFVGGIDKLKKDYENTKNNVASTKKALGVCEKNVKELEDGLRNRITLWENIRDDFAQIITIKFNDYLSQRGHSGGIEFNHDKQELEIKVQTEMAKQLVDDEKDIKIDTKGLSGGERSFSTVSFLLSLWEVVESPFRVLDEFDIFMDAIYRKQSMDILINSGKTKFKNRQLIILTPHDISQIKVGTDIKILTLKKPQRSHGQTILDQYSQKK